MLETGQVKTLSGTPEILEKNCGRNIEPMPNHHDLFYSLFFQKISFDFETMIGYVTKHCDISNSLSKSKKLVLDMLNLLFPFSQLSTG